MERTLKLRNAVTFVVGIVIGSGIFASPGFVIAEVGSPGASLCVWALCGMLTTMGSLSMAELSAALPSSGGEAVCVFPLARTSAEWTRWLAL
jgi:L-type amino acid transporter 9